MKTFWQFCTAVAIIVCCGTSGVWAQNGDLLFSQVVDNQSTFGPSELWPATGTNSEVADDFNVVGMIERVVANGFVWGIVDFRGAYVRFYEYAAGGSPGLLQHEYFLATGFDPATGTIDATLSPPFIATGKHFVSVQPVINYWYWWSASTNAPRGQPFFFRNFSVAPSGWQHGDNLNFSVNADIAFSLYGGVTAPGAINSLSATTLPRSGFLEIFGNNFGSDGQVFIGGVSAPVSYWSSNRVIAYVPERAPLTTVPVQIVTEPGATNTKSLTVTAHPPSAGRVNWRFRMDGPYSLATPAIGSDGTIYSVDAFFHLYAVAADGGLKWVVRGAGDKGVTVGPDGTIYTASESDIKAFNPDGSSKWTFVQNPRAFICLGVAVGPDGNIFSVATQGLGVFSLTPAGQLRWNVTENYSRLIVDRADIVFGLNGTTPQLYFGANAHTRALRLDGAPVFTLSGAFQPAIGPDGSVHAPFGAYSPNGLLRWNFVSSYPYNILSRPDVGPDGIHYVTQNSIQLFALNPNGTQRWHATLSNSMGAPALDPSNSILVLGGANTLNIPGSIQAVSALDGGEIWRVLLPAEDPAVFNPVTGTFGYNQSTDIRGVFSKDGAAVYFLTSIATGSNDTSRSFIYSVATGVSNANIKPSPTPTSTPVAMPSPVAATVLRCANISLSVGLVRKGSVTVNAVMTVTDDKGAAVFGATVEAVWTLPNGSKIAQSVSSNKKGNATATVKSSPGTYTISVRAVSKPGYSFDAAGSALTKSITR